MFRTDQPARAPRPPSKASMFSLGALGVLGGEFPPMKTAVGLARGSLQALALALLVTGPAAAAATGVPPDSYALTVWTVEKGLPSGDVWAMAQDLDGYLWLGTTAGL